MIKRSLSGIPVSQALQGRNILSEGCSPSWQAGMASHFVNTIRERLELLI